VIVAYLSDLPTTGKPMKKLRNDIGPNALPAVFFHHEKLSDKHPFCGFTI
jgi:hypothetical protein